MSQNIIEQVLELTKTMTTQQMVYHFEKRGLRSDLVSAIPSMPRGHKEAFSDCMKVVVTRMEVERPEDANRDVIQEILGR